MKIGFVYKSLLKLFLLLFSLFLIQSCRIYSFTGAAVSPDIKTISIQNFINESAAGPPRLSQNFTEKLRDYFQSNSSLKLVKNEGDLMLEGKIIAYEITPIAPVGGATGPSTRSRLTIRVQAKFENTKDTAQSFNQSFQYYSDYDASVSLSTIENRLIDDEISPQIVFDIFNKALANW